MKACLKMTITSRRLPPALAIGMCLLTSCSTWYIPVDSFKKQLAGLDSSTPREVTTLGPLGERVSYQTYRIDSILAFDKNGKPVVIPNGPSIEIRITDSANRKTIFYFDLILFDGVNIVGRQSRLLSAAKTTIPIRSVKTIEVQNGRKNFRYVK